MADKAKKKLIKKTETVRERANKTTGPVKTRRLSGAATQAGRPFRLIARLLAFVLRPFGFLLWPFKTRPMRFVGRVLASVLLLRFFRNAGRELRQVEWPGRKETTKLTIAVFTFAIAFGLIIAITDYGLDKLFRKVLIK